MVKYKNCFVNPHCSYYCPNYFNLEGDKDNK